MWHGKVRCFNDQGAMQNGREDVWKGGRTYNRSVLNRKLLFPISHFANFSIIKWQHRPPHHFVSRRTRQLWSSPQATFLKDTGKNSANPLIFNALMFFFRSFAFLRMCVCLLHSIYTFSYKHGMWWSRENKVFLGWLCDQKTAAHMRQPAW